ncbi:MAG: transcription-repair coupling factor [Rhodobacteraceae bacterium]|nr:transcription-repair coupling factor [Paracoccaceae bacterium]
MSQPLPNGIVKVGGAPEGYDARILADTVARAGGPVLCILRDDRQLAAMRDALRFFQPDMPVFEFPAWDCLAYDRISPNPDVSARRMSFLAAFHNGWSGACAVLTTVNAAMQRVPSREVMAASAFTAVVGKQISTEKLFAYLERAGFSRAPTVMEPGDYAVRGGLIDIYPPGDIGPIRLDLFGDVLDAARRFDAGTQRTIEKIKRIELAPVSEVILDAESIQRFRSNYRQEFGAAGRDDPLYEAVSEGRKHQGMEHWLPYFYEHLDTLFDYMDAAPVVLVEQVMAQAGARWDGVQEQYATRKAALGVKSHMATVYKPVPPALLYLSPESFDLAIAGRPVRQLSTGPQPSGPGVVDMGGRVGRNFSPERQQENVSLFGALADHIKVKRKTGQVVLTSYSAGSRERFGSLLTDAGVEGFKDIPCFQDRGKGALSLAVWGLETGFEADGLTVISEQDILGDRLIRPTRKRRKAANYLTEAHSLTPGDLVVHIDHGIGRYHGLETISAAGAPHECIVLEYAGSSKLFLPVENIELLSRYGHDEGMLDRLGGGAWQAKKAKLKERIREMADKLIRVAAERALRKGKILTPPEGLWAEFCARFPYTETDDQLNAIDDVIADLSSGQPMDRLICGDVGFGKTEVAMRAAFVAVMSGVQVAIIAPTTLLARQHAQSFSERFRGLPVEVRQMSRFVSTKETANTREGLARGTVDIVIGTHALLAKNIRFANLGMVVIDEEQKFGVTHKERLKALKSEVHVLTLSATPIPRTLQMALSGVRELSLIGTPPVDRLAIRTYVSEFDQVTIREALLREHYRGGQSFYVVPRVKDIADIEDFLREQVPEVKFTVAHGQMPAGELDDKMNAFYDGQYDVLLATTIVESGLDIPAANTLIVHRADMFGLSQLYQIRGRVGRSKIRAYAYFTTKPRKPLTPQAEKRLKVLGSLDSLGAGFTIASQDLDIRGAGNILGDEQSGQVREVGYELYQEMLEEAISKMKAGELEGLSDADDHWAPQINLGVPVLIPDDYVADLDVRLGLYRRLSSLSSKVELEGFAAELIDRFGKLPREVTTLMNIVRIKTACRKAGIAKLDGGPKGATIQFYKDKFANPAGLIDFIHAQNGHAKVRDNKIVIRRDWPNNVAKIKGAFSIAQDLAKLAKA